MKFLVILLICPLYLSKCVGWVILDFPQVKDLYAKERAKFKGVDPFLTKSSEELKHYCDVLKVAGIYGVWDSSKPPPPMVIVPQNPPSSTLNYELTYEYNKVASQRKPVPMFACLTHNEDAYWFLSYGFNNDYLFIFTHHEGDDNPIFEIKGLLENTPTLDKNLQRGNIRELLFANSVPAIKNPLPNITSVAMYHFRLCSLILDVIRNANPDNDFYTINFGVDYGNQTSVRRPVMFEHIESKQNFVISAIPCAMNRRFHRPNFVIVTNPDDLNSVFVLLENEDLMDGQIKYVVKYYIRDVSVLKNWVK